MIPPAPHLPASRGRTQAGAFRTFHRRRITPSRERWRTETAGSFVVVCAANKPEDQGDAPRRRQDDDRGIMTSLARELGLLARTEKLMTASPPKMRRQIPNRVGQFCFRREPALRLMNIRARQNRIWKMSSVGTFSRALDLTIASVVNRTYCRQRRPRGRSGWCPTGSSFSGRAPLRPGRAAR